MKTKTQWWQHLMDKNGASITENEIEAIQNDAILLGAEICNELKETAGSLNITSKRQMAELCEKEIRMAAMPNDPSSATRRTGRNDCKPRRPAGFAAAHG
jgi:hypothetical protein